MFTDLNVLKKAKFPLKMTNVLGTFQLTTPLLFFLEKKIRNHRQLTVKEIDDLLISVHQLILIIRFRRINWVFAKLVSKLLTAVFRSKRNIQLLMK